MEGQLQNLLEHFVSKFGEDGGRAGYTIVESKAEPWRVAIEGLVALNLCNASGYTCVRLRKGLALLVMFQPHHEWQ